MILLLNRWRLMPESHLYECWMLHSYSKATTIYVENLTNNVTIYRTRVRKMIVAQLLKEAIKLHWTIKHKHGSIESCRSFRCRKALNMSKHISMSIFTFMSVYVSMFYIIFKIDPFHSHLFLSHCRMKRNHLKNFIVEIITIIVIMMMIMTFVK